MDFGAILAADQTCYFIIGRQENSFFCKKYGTMYRQIKSQGGFKIEQNVTLPTKDLS